MSNLMSLTALTVLPRGGGTGEEYEDEADEADEEEDEEDEKDEDEEDKEDEAEGDDGEEDGCEQWLHRSPLLLFNARGHLSDRFTWHVLFFVSSAMSSLRTSFTSSLIRVLWGVMSIP